MRWLKLSLFCCCSKDKKGKKTTIVPLLNQNGNAGKIGQCLNPLTSFWFKKKQDTCCKKIIQSYYLNLLCSVKKAWRYCQVWKKILKVVCKQKLEQLKVIKYWKQFMISSILLKKTEKTKKIGPRTSRSSYVFWENWGSHKLILIFSDL